MLGILLITWKNGRIVKPYGLKRQEKYNMKFSFICIVILVSCSVCASGDLEIYPDLKFDLSSEEQRPRLETGEDASFYGENYRLWPWERARLDGWRNRKKQQDFSIELPDQMQKIEDLLGRNPIDDDLPPIFYNPRNFEEVSDEYRNRKFERFNYANPSSQILDDVRPYPHEDDFSFGDDDVGEEVLEERSNSQPHHAQHTPPVEVEKGEEVPANGLVKDAKVVDDPTEFAYPPSDPRFFQNVDKDNGDRKVKSKLQQLKDNNIRLSHRSGESATDQSRQLLRGRVSPADDQVSVVAVQPQLVSNESAGVYIIAVVAGISAAATVGLIAVGIGWYNLQKHVKNASDVEYPAYGVTGPNKDVSPSGDRRLAQSAQMYHYQHQKQQIIAMESRAAAGDRHGSVSEADSDEENEEGDYTVYECPGLAPTGEMEVKNPLFQDDPTPAQTPPVKPNPDEKK